MLGAPALDDGLFCDESVEVYATSPVFLDVPQLIQEPLRTMNDSLNRQFPNLLEKALVGA